MTDRDRAEMQTLLEQFRRAMARRNDVLLYDHEAKQRVGEMIGKAVQPRGSAFGYAAKLSWPKRSGVEAPGLPPSQAPAIGTHLLPIIVDYGARCAPGRDLRGRPHKRDRFFVDHAFCFTRGGRTTSRQF
jgi:hypothetical protein